MKYFKSLSLIFILVVSLFTFSPNSSDAHSTTCKPGSESLGYIVNCGAPYGHAGTSVIRYYFDNVPTKYRTFTSNGAIRWINTGVVQFTVTTSSYTNNVVRTHYDSNTSTVAYVDSTYNSSTGHKTKWIMSYNEALMTPRGDSKNIGTATHEFGHTIGLGDLKNGANSTKLMYGYSSRMTGYPTSSEITGAKEAIK